MPARIGMACWSRALHGDDRTAGNTITTVQQPMSLLVSESASVSLWRSKLELSGAILLGS
jgi:hypothetical protein